MHVLVQSITLMTEGGWLAQIIITSDGMISGVTDYGNFAVPFRAFAPVPGLDAVSKLEAFITFIKSLGEDYFASKIESSISYMATSKQLSNNCKRLSSKILPALKAAFEKEKVVNENVVIESGNNTYKVAHPTPKE